MAADGRDGCCGGGRGCCGTDGCCAAAEVVVATVASATRDLGLSEGR